MLSACNALMPLPQAYGSGIPEMSILPRQIPAEPGIYLEEMRAEKWALNRGRTDLSGFRRKR
jgi:hypothetical protein